MERGRKGGRGSEKKGGEGEGERGRGREGGREGEGGRGREGGMEGGRDGGREREREERGGEGEELSRVIRKSRSLSAPSPLDRISYTILKRCPSLHPALLNLFNRVIMEGSVPSAWKVAVVKLIPKSSAKEDPSSPGNFRPIALTPVISQLLRNPEGAMVEAYACTSTQPFRRHSFPPSPV